MTHSAGWDRMLKEHPTLVTEIVQNFSKGGEPPASTSTVTNSAPTASPSAPKNWRRVSFYDGLGANSKTIVCRPGRQGENVLGWRVLG